MRVCLPPVRVSFLPGGPVPVLSPLCQRIVESIAKLSPPRISPSIVPTEVFSRLCEQIEIEIALEVRSYRRASSGRLGR